MLLTALTLSAALAAETPDYAQLLAEREDLTTDAFLASLPPGPTSSLPFKVQKARHYKDVVERLQLTSTERAALHRDGFTIVDHGKRYSMGSMYYAIYAQDLPILITTDSILHAMHRSFDDLLMQLELRVLLPAIDSLLESLHAAVVADAGATPSQAHTDLDLHLTIARALLNGQALPPPKYGPELPTAHTSFDQDDQVDAILAKVRSLDLETPDTPKTQLYGRTRMVDWSQFRPRGHYTKAHELQRYFQAMMWLGRADTGFELKHDREVHAAVLLAAMFEDTGALASLDELERLLGWIVGPSDNLGPPQMLAAMEHADLAPADVYAPGAVDTLRSHMDGSQRIRSQVIVSHPHDPERVPPPELFQIFGQRFVPDSFVLSEVVFDSIRFEGRKVKRMMPSGLDVATALGNNEAARILGETDLREHPYAANLSAARAWMDGQPESFWTDTATNTWLATLRHLHTDLSDEPNAPAAMKGAAWQRKQLQTQLASWAEYRHDTILYAKQSYAGWPACEYPAGYVEPYPAVYKGTAAFARSLGQAVGQLQIDRLVNTSDDRRLEMAAEAQRRQVAFLEGFSTRAGWLASLAEKELAGEPFSPADVTLLKATIDQRGGGSGPPRYDGWYTEMFYGGGIRASEWSPEVVDVHTDPESGQVLEVGTGDVDFLVAAIDNEGDTRVYVGPVYSYYETTWPVQDRLTDEAWGELIFQGQAPDRPAWMDSLLHGETAREL